MEETLPGKVVEVPEDEDYGEALSLSDLPLIHHQETGGLTDNTFDTEEEEFDFCSLSREPEMCAADVIFLQGQILPLHHYLISDQGPLQHRNSTRAISRSESMEHYSSSGLTTSRCTSPSSLQSSSSSSAAAPATNFYHKPPSGTNPTNPANRSSIWNIFKLGLITAAPVILFQNLDSRRLSSPKIKGSNKFGSHSSSNTKKSRLNLHGGCRCSTAAVDAVIINRSVAKSIHVQHKKTRHHRTVEWLKQLSLENSGGGKRGISE